MASLDTNLLVRWVVRDSPQADIADRLFSTEAPLYLSGVALAELEHVLRHVYAFSRMLISEHFSSIISSGYFELDEAILTTALERYAQYPSLSFVDCWLTTEAEKNGKAPLYTFDKKLAKQLVAAKHPS